MLLFRTCLGAFGFAVFAIWLTWGLFLMVMLLKRNLETKNLPIEAKVLGYPWLAVMIVADFIFNVTVGTVMFLDIPRDLLFTKRLDRMLDRSGWRRKLAQYICRTLLDPFDPDGRHCIK